METQPVRHARGGWPREVVALGMALSAVAGALVMTTLPQLSPRAAAALGRGRSIELTLVATDRENLACGSSAVVEGLHCAFDAAGKPWAKDEAALVLQPFTTTDGKQLLGAGLWSDPGLGTRLPSKRFRARCDFAPAGEAAAPRVRWAPGPFKDAAATWPAGRLSKCTVLEG